MNGNVTLGSAFLVNNVATLSLRSLPSGTFHVQAVYGGDANFDQASTATQTVSVATLAPGFTLTSDSASVNITDGQQGIVVLELAANASFSGQINLSCSGIPSSGNCSVVPGNVSLSAGGTNNATLVIGTSSTHSTLREGMPFRGKPSGFLSVAAMLGALFGVGRRRRRRLGKICAPMLVLSVVFGIAGCSDNNSQSNSASLVAPGVYTVNVSATPAAGNQVATQMLTFTVTVK